jgi:hypothetical protein
VKRKDIAVPVLLIIEEEESFLDVIFQRKLKLPMIGPLRII